MSSIHLASGIQGGGKHKGFTPETGTWFIDVFIHLGRKSTLFLLLVSPRAPPRPPPMPPSATGNFCLLHPISQAKPTPFRPHPCARGEDSFPGVKKKDKKKKLWWLLARWHCRAGRISTTPSSFCFLFKNVPLLARNAGGLLGGKQVGKDEQSHDSADVWVKPLGTPRGLCDSL